MILYVHLLVFFFYSCYSFCICCSLSLQDILKMLLAVYQFLCKSQDKPALLNGEGWQEKRAC